MMNKDDIGLLLEYEKNWNKDEFFKLWASDEEFSKDFKNALNYNEDYSFNYVIEELEYLLKEGKRNQDFQKKWDETVKLLIKLMKSKIS